MDSISKRVYQEALYLVKNNKTIRDTARQFNVSKSTVHKDIQQKLSSIDKNLYIRAQEVLDYNAKVKHIRGGESTKQKYLKLR